MPFPQGTLKFNPKTTKSALVPTLSKQASPISVSNWLDKEFLSVTASV